MLYFEVNAEEKSVYDCVVGKANKVYIEEDFIVDGESLSIDSMKNESILCDIKLMIANRLDIKDINNLKLIPQKKYSEIEKNEDDLTITLKSHIN